uniref:NXPE family member 3 n=1 Tax=Neogobius melanostomus TaxID=47308 RepID=A0A8C6UBN1_9GOBI
CTLLEREARGWSDTMHSQLQVPFHRNRSEGRKLLNNITASWPETAPLSKPFSRSLTTSSAKSSFTIVPRSGGWRVGDELTVKIQLRDYNGNPKKSGGDFLISKLHNSLLGQVEDHSNGTFTVVFPLLWNGTVTLVHASESITVLKRVMDESPGRIYFRSFFKSGQVTEKTICNVCLDPDKAPLCNLTDPITGEQWFCYKPKTLDCYTRIKTVLDDLIQCGSVNRLIFKLIL